MSGSENGFSFGFNQDNFDLTLYQPKGMGVNQVSNNSQREAIQGLARIALSEVVALQSIVLIRCNDEFARIDRINAR